MRVEVESKRDSHDAVRGVVIRPGRNLVDKTAWSRASAHPLVIRRLRRGQYVVIREMATTPARQAGKAKATTPMAADPKAG